MQSLLPGRFKQRLQFNTVSTVHSRWNSNLLSLPSHSSEGWQDTWLLLEFKSQIKKMRNWQNRIWEGYTVHSFTSFNCHLPQAVNALFCEIYFLFLWEGRISIYFLLWNSPQGGDTQSCYPNWNHPDLIGMGASRNLPPISWHPIGTSWMNASAREQWQVFAGWLK